MREDDNGHSNNAPQIEEVGADSGGRVNLVSIQAAAIAAAAPVSPQAIRMYPGPDGVLQLPAGVEMSDVRVVGNDLVITLPNGVQWIIVDGALYVPTLSFGAVQIPAENVAALLDIENFILTGNRQSSGGNFAVDVGGIGDPFALGDLLPPTDLVFEARVEEDIDFPFPDEQPGVIVITPQTPAGSIMAGATVDEPGLPARPNETPGTNASAPTETTAGTITVTSGDGPFVIVINGTTITTVGQVIVTPTGTLVITSVGPDTVGYNYTLTDNTSGDTVTDVLTITVTDSDGDVATGTLTITIVDDNPVAVANLNNVVEGGIVSVSAASGVLANDIPGADGFAAGGGVVGVRAAAGNTTTAVTTGVGTVIQGQFGTLTLQANGSYVYDAAPNAVPAGGATDVFVYTIRDGDGDQSTTTLSISLSDSGLAATADDAVTVNEAALATGSNPASTAETATGTLADGNVSGGTGPFSYALVGSGTGSFGTLTLNANGTYSYTLTSPFDTSPDANNGNNLENNRDTFTYQVTDANGNTTTSTISIDIVDDVPTAVLNTNSVTEGAVISGNVVGNDVFGADGAAAGGGVVGVRAAGGDSTSAVTTGVGTTINGQFGTLTLQANGSYVYDGAPNVVPPAGATDVFVYTIRDGDGDQSTTTLTISLSDSGLAATADDAVTVNEAALASGSNPASNAETATGTLADGNVSGGTGPYSYALVGSGAGSFGTLTLNANGTYSYTLTSRFDTSPDANNGTNLENNRDNFTYQVTDANGNTTTSTISIDIVDDVPTAVLNSNSVTEGAVVSGNVVGNDVFGADGAAAGGGVVGVRAAGGDTTSAVTTGVGTTINGQFGTLTLQANGSYVYDAAPNAVPAGGATDVFVYTIRDGDGDQSTTTLTISLSDSGLAATADDAVTVNEAALASGSNPASNAETATGTLADGNVSGGTGPYSYALVGSGTGNFGTLTLNANGTYSYTLASPFDTSPDANNGTNLENNRDNFTYQVTDANGNTTTSTISIDIVDDVPTAVLNSNNVGEGAAVSGNVLGNDVFGADGAAAGGGVVGVRAAGGDTNTAVTTGVGSVINGQFGTLTLNANGSYTYNSTPNAAPAGGATDTFVYTIRDGDGDQSTTTLTITISDANLVATPDDAVTVSEAALATGSNPGSNAETATGTLADGNVTGGTGPFNYALVGSGTGSFGTLTLNANGTYSYTLTSRYDTSPDANDGNNVENNRDTFTYRVTDANGNTTTSTISIDIVDDVPTAVLNTNAVIEGAVVSGNVVGNDVFGADGAAAGGGVVGVRTAGGDTTTAVTTGVGTTVNGQFGTLTLQANGSYVYDGAPNVVPPAGATDVFVYTIRDGDGDQATTTLTINLSDSGLAAPADSDVLVNENALDTAQTGADLAPGTVTGSLPGSTAETDSSNQLNATGGTGPYTYALQTGGNAATAGSFGTIQVNSDGSYTYTLTRNVDSADANNGAHTVNGAESFIYVATDANGNTVTGTISIAIVDDVPTANLDFNSVAQGALLTVSAASGILANDFVSADGTAIAGVRASGGDTTTAVTNGNLVVVTAFGTLTVAPNGSYAYQANPNVGPATDTFVYSLIDGDGDLSTTTLTISIAGPSLSAPDDFDATVNEAGLDLNEDGADLAPGTVTGSLPGPNTETDSTNQLNATGGTGPYTYQLVTGGNAETAGTYGSIQLNSNGTYTYTLTTRFNHPDGGGAQTASAAESFQYRVTDANGNTQTGFIRIAIVDDVPLPYSTAPAPATGVNAIGTVDLTNSLNLPAVGADSPGTLTFTLTDPHPALDTTGKALTYNGQPLFYTLNALDSTILEARTSSTPGQGTLVFRVDLDQANNNYSYEQFFQLSTSAPLKIIDLSSVGGGNVPTKAINVPNTPFDLILTTKPGETVNTSSSSIGVGGGQSMSSGDVVRIDFIQNIAVTKVNGNDVLTYGEYYSGNEYRQDVSGLSSQQRGNFIVRAITKDEAVGSTPTDPADGDATFYGDTNDDVLSVLVTQIKIYDAAGTLVNVADYAALGITVAPALVGGGWQITGLPNDYDFQITSTTAFQAVEIEATLGSGTFKLGFIDISATVVQGVSFEIPIRLTDADGDFVGNNVRVNLSAPIQPVALDLDGDGVEFVDRSAGVAFDYDADGRAESTGWVASDDGLLVNDANGDRAANDGSEIVFSVNGSTDLDGLRQTYDSDGDGKLTAGDSAFAQFGVWQDANSNGRTDAGEYRTLTEAGIVSIDLVSDGAGYSPNGDVRVSGTSTYTRSDGSTGAVADASFGVSSAQLQRASSQAITNSIVAAGLVATAGASIQPVAIAAARPLDAFQAPNQPSMLLDHSELPVTVADLGLQLPRVFGASEMSDPANLSSRLTSHDQPFGGSSDPFAEVSAPVRSPSLVTQDHGSPVLVDHSAIPVAPMVDMSAAALIMAPAAELQAVLADALPQAANGPEIDSLLSHLPSGGGADGVPGGGGGGGLEVSMAGSHFAPVVSFEHGGFDLSAFINTHMVMQDAAAATAQA